MTRQNVELVPKKLDLLHQLVPAATSIALLVNPTNPAIAEPEQTTGEAAVRKLGLELHVLEASDERGIDEAFTTVRRLRAGAFVISAEHTRTVPIVIANGCGPLQAEIAESYARPGGNVTGVVNLGEELTSKQLQLLKTIPPGTSQVGVLTTGIAIIYEETLRDATRAASALNLKLVEGRISSLGDLPRLAALCGKGNCNGLLVTSDPLLQNWRVQIVSAASQQNLPAVYSQPEYVRDGGLISYAANIGERFHRAATYVDKILKGAKQNELPIEQPTKFELIVNAKTV